VSKSKSSTLFKRLWHDYTKRHSFKLLIAIFFMLLEGYAMYVFVNTLQPMFDVIFIAGDESQIWPITLAVCGVFVIRGIGSFIHRSLTVKTGVLIVGDIQRNLTRHLLSLDVSFFNRHSPGELIERVRGDTQALQGFASTTLLTLGRDTALLVAMLSNAVDVDVMWTLMIFVGFPLLVIPIGFLQKLIRKQTRKARSASASLSTRLDEIFHGIKAIKLNNLAKHEDDRFYSGVNTFVKTQMKSEYSRAAMPSLIDIIAGVGFVAVIYYGGQEIIAGEKTAGEFMRFFTAIALVLDPIRRLTNISGAIQGAIANLERIYFLFDQHPKPRMQATSQSLATPYGDIEFKNIDFGYTEQPVLNKLSFIAPGGKTTAFVGPSGAGKSTLFNVLTQLELPTEGRITIGGQDISTIDTKALRHDIAVVSQESALFDESLYENIKLGDLDSNDETVAYAAKAALVSKFADSLPEQLDTLAGPRGSNLSGGQRQRVIIARALLRNAPILLLDEATSALDNQTEQKIQSLLDDFAKDKTTLVIAHRLTTVMNADLIHVMQKGTIVESGTHQELLALNNHYAALYKTLEV
jgi:ABC-type multidrug transport system fused ATPase/permease subunit